MPKISLDQIPLFSSLAPGDLSQIAGTMFLKKLQNGEILFYEGDVGDRLYVILDGELEVLKAVGTPEERMLNSHGPGVFVGEMSLLMKENRRTASVRARGPVELLELRKRSFDELLEQRPALAYHMVRELSERLRASDESTILDLREKNVELAQAYEDLKAAQAQIVEKEKLEHELSMARDIQMSILPEELIAPENIQVGAKMIPARAVGGDLYDVIPLGGGRVGVAIGDVSDKGVPAALFMAQFCTLLRVEAQRSSKPEDVLRNVNNPLVEMNRAGFFVTAIYGIFDAADHSFTYARAGHELPVIFDEKGNASQPGHDQGMPLGLFEDSAIDVQTVSIPPGSTLLMYTDGGTDALNAQENFFGLENLQTTIARHLNASAQELCERVIEELLSYQEQDAQFDDVTLVAIRSLE